MTVREALKGADISQIGPLGIQLMVERILDTDYNEAPPILRRYIDRLTKGKDRHP